jgi:hypothetical protein
MAAFCRMTKSRRTGATPVLKVCGAQSFPYSFRDTVDGKSVAISTQTPATIQSILNPEEP